MCFSWYALGEGDRSYRPLPVEVTLGPDLAKPLRPVWKPLEENAERLDRLVRQQARVTFDVIQGRKEPALTVSLRLGLLRLSEPWLLEADARPPADPAWRQLAGEGIAALIKAGAA